jgi:GlpG protein
MRTPPSLLFWNRYLITTITALLALLVTLSWWGGVDISFLFCGAEVSQGELWRLVTSTLPHVNLIHLAFNLYWLWVFSTAVEGVFGHWRTFALLSLLAFASSAAQYALSDGGVGLSGVGYGLFGLLWVLSRKDPRFANVVDGQTVWLFVGWFFFCIALSWSDLMQIGNVAHGAGAIAGLLLGATLITHGELQKLLGTATAGFVLLCLFGALIGRPYINQGANYGAELAYLGYRDLERGRDERAVQRFRRALERDDRQAGWWYNLGVAYSRLHRDQDALTAFQHAVDLEPRSIDFRKTLDEWEVYMKAKKRPGQEE